MLTYSYELEYGEMRKLSHWADAICQNLDHLWMNRVGDSMHIQSNTVLVIEYLVRKFIDIPFDRTIFHSEISIE